MLPDVACSAGFLGHGYQDGDAGDRHNHELEDEEPLQLVWWCEEDRELDGPEDQVRNHLLGCYPDAFRNVIWDVEVGGPDGSDHLRYCCGAGIGLDCVPEESRCHADNDGESSKVPSKR